MAALDAFITEYEAEHGVITDEEIESASRRAGERAIAVKAAGLVAEIDRTGEGLDPRLLAVAAGEAQLSSLTPAERAIAHALIDARIAERVASERFGPDATD